MPDRDRMIERMRRMGIDPHCRNCAHYHGDSERTCTAYPEGVPGGILIGLVDHSKPQHDDGGIQFEPDQKSIEAYRRIIKRDP